MTNDTTAPANEPARIIPSRPRARKIDLQWPVAFGGREYHAITLVRLTAGDVAKFQADIEAMLSNDPGARVRFPIYRDDVGEPIPGEVLDALDDDDLFELERAARLFLPRRFLGLSDDDSGRGTGENIEHTSEK